MTEKTKYIIFDVSNEWESMIAVVGYGESRSHGWRVRVETAKALREKDSDLSSLSFFDDIELYEYGSWFESWLNERDLEGEWDDASTAILSDDEPRPPSDDLCIRVATVLFHASPYGFWWKILPKHSGVALETRYLPLEDGLAKEILGV